MVTRKTRNRAKKPTWSFSGLSAAEWRLTPTLVEWAQGSPEFRSLVTLLVNDKPAVLDTLPGVASENRLLGRAEAYDAVRLHLLSLAEGHTPTPDEPTKNATYEPEEVNPLTVESDFVDTN